VFTRFARGPQRAISKNSDTINLSDHAQLGNLTWLAPFPEGVKRINIGGMQNLHGSPDLTGIEVLAFKRISAISIPPPAKMLANFKS
jgi:hypothetical protein